MSSCKTTWSTVPDVSTTWGIVPDQTLIYDQIEGSPMGLLMALTYSSTVTHYIGPQTAVWSEAPNVTTSWTEVNPCYDYIMLENGDHLLLETGFKIIK